MYFSPKLQETLDLFPKHKIHCISHCTIHCTMKEIIRFPALYSVLCSVKYNVPYRLETNLLGFGAGQCTSASQSRCIVNTADHIEDIGSPVSAQ